MKPAEGEVVVVGCVVDVVVVGGVVVVGVVVVGIGGGGGEELQFPDVLWLTVSPEPLMTVMVEQFPSTWTIVHNPVAGL
jgi:hypothetical protein